jgi:hypothetical protein
MNAFCQKKLASQSTAEVLSIRGIAQNQQRPQQRQVQSSTAKISTVEPSPELDHTAHINPDRQENQNI